MNGVPMAESVADAPKLAPLWDAGQNPQPASKVEARSFRYYQPMRPTELPSGEE